MIFNKAFAINNTDIVAANNIHDAKRYWLKNNMIFRGDPYIRECDLDKDGLMVEVQGEMEAVEILMLLPMGGETSFKRTKEGVLLMWVCLREALKSMDAPEPFLVARVG